jgi:hypothetical protein
MADPTATAPAPRPVPPAPGPRAWWHGLPARTRRRLKRALVAAIVVVLAVSVVLGRFLSVENTERDTDLALIEAQARGDAASMIAQISGCRTHPACLATVRANVANPRLRRAGAVKILSLESPTAYSLTGAAGKTRLAWTVIGKLPVVQCVGVSRTGNFLTGIHVHIVSLSVPIENEGQCSGKTRHVEEEEAEVRSLNGP